MRSRLLLLALCIARVGHAQLQLEGTITPAQLVQEVLLGSGITASNITFNGQPANVPNAQIGRFEGDACVLQLDSGLLLATGGINVALGPNTSGSAFSEVEGNFFSDNDLDNVAGDMAMDIACLEFDFVPTGDSISFRYAFASEEYLEWVNSIFNDAFGFFLSGPGIFGPFDNDAVNLAVAPGTLSYVSVNTINNVLNAAHYQDNGNGFSAPYATDPYYIQFDGFTVGLTARAQVQCGQTYHLKMIIGDVGDPNWDSGVFIVGGTFSSTGGAQINIATTSGTDAVLEGCDSATVTITRASTSGAAVVPVQMSGTATAADVSGVPASVAFADGQAAVSFPIAFAADGLAEGAEVLTLCASIPGACNGGSSACASVTLADAPSIVISVPDAVSDCSGAPITLEADASGGAGALAFSWSTGAANSFIVVPDISATYAVTVTDACGNQATASAAVEAPCGVEVPNVITPNGDGVNDAFVVAGIERHANHLRIFNRWGQVVYETDNYRNTWRGGEVSDGTYYYELALAGSGELLTGHLTILANHN